MISIRRTARLTLALLVTVSAAWAQDVVLEPVADSHVYEQSRQGWNESNWGAYPGLAAGWHPTGGECRTYLKFDLSGSTLDPKGRAVLRIYHYHTGGSAAMKLAVCEVAGPWTEGTGASRTKADGLTGATQPAIASSPSATFSPGAKTDRMVEVDVTALVRGWLGGKPNHGLAIVPLERGTSESFYGFCSRESGDKARRPTLVLLSADPREQDRRKGPVSKQAAAAAYERYIAAYNRFVKLIHAGKGETDEGKRAYAEYVKAKAAYEKFPLPPLESH